MKRSEAFGVSVVNQVNPIWLPREDGTGIVFPSYMDCYIYFMDKCQELAPRGYMDICMLLVGLYRWKFSMAISFYKVNLSKKLGNRISLMKIGDAETKMFYKTFLICLHDYYHTTFDMQAFEQAWQLHKQHVKTKILMVNDYDEKKQSAEGNPQQ